jgi:signal transduction histidine kinase
VEFEIRVFDLRYKQPYGIRVDKARDYFNKYGGVYLYDSGFRVPYYGPDNDWLRVEIDHSHRLSRSKLLPEELHVSEGMNNLPTNSRLFGVVNISTATERKAAKEHKRKDHLDLQVSRDRLIDNPAFRQLAVLVRWALDYYAMRKTARMLEEVLRTRTVESPEVRAVDVVAVLDQHSDVIPAPVAREIKTAVDRVVDTVQYQTEAVRSEMGLLTSLATAGMMALALQHELTKQLYILADITTRLESSIKGSTKRTKALQADLDAIGSWVENARQTQLLFGHLKDEADRSQRARLEAPGFLSQVVSNMRPFLRGVEVNIDDVDSDLLLPLGTVAEWTALFQNVFTNVINAMVDSPTKRIVVTSSVDGPSRSIQVLDTGSGVDLKSSEDLFEPFHRRTAISPERAELAYGGTGLGLTIVRLIATDLRVDVRFTDPPDPFSTCFEISWREQK